MGIYLHFQLVYNSTEGPAGFFPFTEVKKGIIMNAKKKFYRMLVSVMSIALCVQTPAAQAEIVSTGTMAAQHQTAVERIHIQAFLDRANVINRVQALGVDGLRGKDRVAALSDQEVHALALKIDSMPAGGDMSNSDWIVVTAAIAILVVVIIASHGSGSGGMGGGY